ncbi:MAG TPA: ATP-binding protein [Mucilaginibacter sp.]|jgi:signal transduction histidine kinase/DNA-binding response OmpR family regulator
MDGFKFIRSVKGKIIIASILACTALFMGWETSKNAFKAVLSAFENVSAPNEKLRILNELSHNVTRLDEIQKSLLNNPAKYYSFFLETKKLSLKIDTLKSLYADKPAQVARLNALDKLLHDRVKLYVSYLKVREGLINNKSFSSQVRLLTAMVNKSAKQTDSLVTTSERKTATTTIFQPQKVEEEHRGFFQKLFGKRKPKDNESKIDDSFQVVDSQLNVKHDTIALAMRDSVLKGLGATVKNMEKAQQTKSSLFVKRETMLTKASTNIVRQILSILKKVEKEALGQNMLNDNVAKSAVENGIKQIRLIVFGLFILTVVLVYFILRDISSINKYRKELELAKEEAEYHALAKHRFLSNMSHEIRTPLQSIIGYAEIVKQQDNPQKKDIETIYQSSTHLLQIVNEVLDYNRIISGKFTFINETFNLQTLLDEVISVLYFQAEKKGITIKTDYDGSVSAFLTGDPFRLKQILYNLLGNAIKFTNDGEVILTVKSKRLNDDQTACKFDITDTGIGISAKDIDRLFNEFEQAGDGHAAKTGTGLGLAITKELIENQGGYLAVKSELGKGSSFSFELQFGKAIPAVNVVERPDVPLSQPDGHKVWIIDDDPFILELCSRFFEQNEISFRSFSSPNEMLASQWDNNVDCVFIDIRMPGMSGLELCKKLRDQISSEPMIYALTAQVMPEEHQSFLKLGFNGILTKPFKEHELIALIKNDSQKRFRRDGEPIPMLNIKVIEKMTSGDTNLTDKILMRFVKDTTNDVDELHVAINENNIEAVILLTHRIAGRTAQVGARELAESFRLAEIDLDRDKTLTAEKIRNILSIAAKLNDLAGATHEYIQVSSFVI